MLKQINRHRLKDADPEISTRKVVIKKLIVLCNFITKCSTNIKETPKKTIKTKQIKKNKITSEIKSKKSRCPMQIENGGFTFILNKKTGKYKRLPKKEFNIDEVKQWGKSRKVQQKTREVIRKKKKKHTKQTQEIAINNILSREIQHYPSDLQKLLCANY